MNIPLKKSILAAVLVTCITALIFLLPDNLITFENIKSNSEALREFISRNYILSVAIFISAYGATALFLPGALLLSLLGGFLYGVFRGTVYINIAAVTGATLAFLSARYVIGDWLQERYGDSLKKFNREVGKRGHNYLLTLRIIPLFPFFLVNILAGITRVPLKTFLWTTSLGMVPGSLLFTYAGKQLGSINHPDEIMTPKKLVVLILIGSLPLLQILFARIKGRNNG